MSDYLQNYQCIGPDESGVDEDTIIDFSDNSDYDSLTSYTIDFWFKKDNQNNDGQKLLDITNNIITVNIIIYNKIINLNMMTNSNKKIDNIANIDTDVVDNKPFDLRYEWHHFSFGYDSSSGVLIIHLNGKKIYAGLDFPNLTLEGMRLHCHNINNPIYFTYIRISKNLKFLKDVFDLNSVNVEYVKNTLENYNAVKDERYFNGKINENTIIYQPFKSNFKNQSTSPLKNLFNISLDNGTKLYTDESVINNSFWKNITGYIGPLSKITKGILYYNHNDNAWELYNWTIDFWFKREQSTTKLVPLISIINNSNAIHTYIYTKENKLLIQTYDKDLSEISRQNDYYSVEIQNNYIKLIKFDIEDNTLKDNILGIPMETSLTSIYNNNIWHHLAITYEEEHNLLQIFLNGNLICTLNEYLDYVLNNISLNTNLIDEDPTYFSCFRLSAVVEFDKNFDMEKFTEFPYDNYAITIPVNRAIVDEITGTLEEVLNQYPMKIPVSFNTALGYLPITEHDNFIQSNNIYANNYGYFTPIINHSDENLIKINGEELVSNSDIYLMNYYPNKNKLKEVSDLVHLPFIIQSDSINDILWNAITANANITSPYNIFSTHIKRYNNVINIPNVDNSIWQDRYAIGPDDNNSSLSLISNTSLGPVWTCEFWFKINKNNDIKNEIIDFFEVSNSDSTSALKLSLEQNRLDYYVVDKNNIYFKEFSKGSINNLETEWKHFAITYDIENTTIFINGQFYYISNTVKNLIPKKINIYLQNNINKYIYITDFKLCSGIKYGSSFSINNVNTPSKVYSNIININRKIVMQQQNNKIQHDFTKGNLILNGKINNKTALYFPIKESNKEYEKEEPIDYNTGITKYDDPYLVEATNSKNYENMLVNDDPNWQGFNPIGPLKEKEDGNIHITNTSGHKSNKYTVEFWMYRKSE